MRVKRYLGSVRSQLPAEAQIILDRTLAGDAIVARRLPAIVPTRLLGHIVVLAYQIRTPNPSYRELLKAACHPEKRHLLTDFWRPQMVRRMLARADFKVPQLQGQVKIYRPLAGLPTRKAAAELFWTLSLDAAIANAEWANTGRSRVLQATVSPTDVIYWGRGKAGTPEIVTRRPFRADVIELGENRVRRAAVETDTEENLRMRQLG